MPDTNRADLMKLKHLHFKHLLGVLCIGLATFTSLAQNDQSNTVLFEESEVHMTAPELRVFITPQVADLEMIYPGKPREEYQQFFTIKSVDALTNGDLDNMQKRALYRFAQEHNADVIIEPIFNSRVSEKDPKRLLISITGYPARYVNFRPLGKSDNDIEMVRTVYPAEFQKVEK